MGYEEGGIVHRYLGHPQQCIEIKVVKIFPDSRCLLEDGSIINRFTKSYYHGVDQCPVPKLKAYGPTDKIVINFPVSVETRIYPSSQPKKRGPYTTTRMSNNTFQCNCPGNTYHPPCHHIKDWREELALQTG